MTDLENDNIPPHDKITAALVLADGFVFWGYGLGKVANTVGEVCFNTSMTGYQEILTDPSYAGQIINFTFPHIGNVGTNDEDEETTTSAVRGLVIRQDITEPSNFRSSEHLNDWCIKQNLTGISGIDTRRLTRYIRDNGAPNGVISFNP
ncbi:MAG: carbamoyl-phosphate synthase domain-containing protein, partial [Emcibacteraceae bacterium]|nr:carbamoyl-phosphate synthase domain-containing protein [Emcibacteraceae bacterium]